MPTEQDNFDLTAEEFRDALTVRYKKPLLSFPPHCDGCGAPSSFDHFLICKKGGLIVQRHNEIRDAIGDLAALLWGQVKCELVVADGCTSFCHRCSILQTNKGCHRPLLPFQHVDLGFLAF